MTLLPNSILTPFQKGQQAWKLFDKENKPVKNPFPKFTNEYKEWQKGFNVGIFEVNTD